MNYNEFSPNEPKKENFDCSFGKKVFESNACTMSEVQNFTGYLSQLTVRELKEELEENRVHRGKVLSNLIEKDEKTKKNLLLWLEHCTHDTVSMLTELANIYMLVATNPLFDVNYSEPSRHQILMTLDTFKEIINIGWRGSYE